VERGEVMEEVEMEAEMEVEMVVEREGEAEVEMEEDKVVEMGVEEMEGVPYILQDCRILCSKLLEVLYTVHSFQTGYTNLI